MPNTPRFQRFNSRARGRARPRKRSQYRVNVREFQLTRPWEGATLFPERACGLHSVSTHAPVGGRDEYPDGTALDSAKFQLTRPWEGATLR